MVCLYGVFVAGVTLNDQALVDLALYGPGGTKDNVTGGFMDCFKPACLRDGVIWGADTKIEEQMAAVCVLTTVAEVMWHHGVDLYGYQDMAMKKSFDAALESAGNGEVSKLLALPGIDAYQYVFRRYQEPRYLPVSRQAQTGIHAGDWRTPAITAGDSGDCEVRPIDVISECEYESEELRTTASVHRR